MQYILYMLVKLFKRLFTAVNYKISTIMSRWLFYTNNFHVRGSLKSSGIPHLSMAIGGSAFIGSNFKMHNSLLGNPIGHSGKCVIFVGPKAVLNIGNNVGMSFCAISCYQSIEIRDNVVLGGGTCIYDSDFHPLNTLERKNNNRDAIKNSRIIIEECVFIGTNSMILKGVTIGKNSIIGACSLVTKNVPPNQIWAGNPARFVRNTE